MIALQTHYRPFGAVNLLDHLARPIALQGGVTGLPACTSVCSSAELGRLQIG